MNTIRRSFIGSTQPGTCSKLRSSSAAISALLLLASHSSIFGQSSGFGAISGVVQDPQQSVIAGAKVLVENSSKGIRRELMTTSTGDFNAPALVPAAGYSVTVSFQGFANYRVTDITVAVGETVTLNPLLQVSASATAVEVTAQAGLIDSTKTDVSQNVTSRQILDLPINGRRVDSFVLLTPGVTSDGPFGLISFRGNPGGNNFQTDGIDTTNAFYDENAGRTRTYNISQDAVQEFQVVSSNFLAEYGRASGGVVNTVTRSGGNDLHGSFYWFFRNRTLNATDPTALGINPPEYRHQTGASVGGPVKKDKIFYFFNGEFQRRNAPIVSSNLSNSNGVFDSAGNFLNTNSSSKLANCDVTVATSAQCQAAVGYLQSRIQAQLLPRHMDVNLLFGKVDFRPTDKDNISLSFNYLDFRSPNGIQTQLSLADGSAIGNNADTNVFDRTARASYTRIVTPNAVNELKFGFFKDRQFDPASPSLLPSIGSIGLSVNGISNVGYATGYPRLNPSEARYQLADTLSYTVRNHSFKFGVDWARVEDYVNRLANRYGSFTYGSSGTVGNVTVSPLTLFALDYSGASAGGKRYSSYSQAFGNPIVDVKMPEVSWFLQDEWHITPKLTITPGVRFDHASIPQPSISNPAFPQTAHIPTNGVNVGPRFGVAYQITPKTVLRAGYGVFYNRYTTSTIENFFLTNGIYQATYSLTSAATIAAGGPTFPNFLAAQPNVTGSSTILYPDSHWRNPYSEQGNVAIEREIAKNTSITVSYVWSRGLHLLQTRDANVAAPSTSYTFPILNASGAQTGAYTTPIYTSRLNPAYGGIYVLESAGNTYYSGGIFQLTRRYSNWFQGNVAYTYSHAIDYNQGGGGNTLFGSTFATSVFNGDYRGEKGSSSIDQRHRLISNAVLAPTFMKGDSAMAKYVVNNWQLSIINLNASSQPLTPTIRVQDAVTGRLSTSSLNGLGGSSRVPFESTSYLDIGNIFRTDARLAKAIPINERFKLTLLFEAFNVFNHTIVGGPSPRITQQYTSIKQTSGALNGQIALVPNSSFGTVLQTQGPPDGTSARRAQVGLRFTF